MTQMAATNGVFDGLTRDVAGPLDDLMGFGREDLDRGSGETDGKKKKNR
jgi:hypothetical protein